jgi:hypothetical protein
MKTLLFALVVLCAVTSAPALSTPEQQRRFNPDGSFWIIGDAPKSFQDFGGINLNSHGNRRLPSSGVNLTNGAVLKFKTISVAREKFTFVTYVRRGVSYRFSGRFLKGGNFFSDIADEDPVLEGTLTKLSNGKVVAESMLKFSYFGGT